MEYINSNITFNNVKEYGVKLTSGPLLINGLAGVDPEDGGIINAVNIDWNGAEVDENTVINTTGELLSWIKNNIGDSNIDNEKLEEIQNTIEVYQTVFSNVVSKTYADNTYAKKTEVESSISELNSALADVRSAINGIDLTELSDKIDVLEQAQENFLTANDIQNFVTANDVQTIVNNRVEQIIGEAPEALDTLKEIADKLGDDDNALSAITETLAEKANSEDVYTKDEVDNIVNGLSEIVETQTQQIETLQSNNAALLERIKRLEKAFSNLVPAEPEDESYNVIVPTSDEPLTLEEIIASINPEAEKPEVVQALNMNQLSNPTDTYLVYPLSWEIVEDDQIVSPVIKDWNGFEIGFSINEDTPTVMVDEVEYRVSDIKLGKGQYTIEFK